MKFKRRRQIEKGKFDLTPLIDVVLLLLIFFMLSSNFITQPGIKVELPYSVNSNLDDSGDITVTLTRDNKLYFNNELINFDGLSRRIKREKRKNPKVAILVKADTYARHGYVVAVMNIARQSGITRLSIAANHEIRQKNE